MKVNIQALKNGLHHFSFEKAGHELGLEPSTFSKPFQVRSDVEKRDQDVFVKTEVQTSAHFVCDNCLEDFSRDVEESFRLMYTSNRDYLQDDDDTVRFWSGNTSEIDLTEGVREALLLAMPMRVVCSEQCRGLCATCGANLNTQPCECRTERIDPRWEGLKGLIC